MELITLNAEPFPKDRLEGILENRGILTNRYAEEYFAHPEFVTEQGIQADVMIASLRETGLENGASLDEIFRIIPERGLRPCSPCTGLFLRLTWTDQPLSRSSVLSGTHRSPDGAVTVLSEPIVPDDEFPKGLYLRNVDGKLWLRGYICDSSFRFSGDDLFAFQICTEN